MDRHYIVLRYNGVRVLIDASTIEIVREAFDDDEHEGAILRVSGEWIAVDENFDEVLETITLAYKNV